MLSSGIYCRVALVRGTDVSEEPARKIYSLVTLKMEMICYSESSVILTRATAHHIPEDNILHCY
jgi:hypothetical protein